MFRVYKSRSLVLLSFALAPLFLSARASADPIWFDAGHDEHAYSSFSTLRTAYADFMGGGNTLLDFTGLGEGTKLADQFATGYGVRFRNTAGGRHDAQSGIRPEGGVNVEDLTGYDGSYMPNGRSLYLKLDNNVASTPFTIQFDTPVAQVGAFLAMGMEGSVHSFTISAFDASGRRLARQVVDSWLWEGTTLHQNYETFFGLRVDDAESPLISRLEILNDSRTNFSNALIVDNVAFSRSAGAPEPSMLALILFGTLVLRPRPKAR